MGSVLMIDLLNFNSATGKCKVLLRDEVQCRIMDGAKHWDRRDVILYSALSGCDFIPRLFRLKTKDIELLMRKWKDQSCNKTMDELLADISNGKH